MKNRMNTRLQVLFLLFAFTLFSCNKQGRDATASDPVDDESNQALYEEVMGIHDEVMPKMDDLYRLKKQLQDEIANTPDLAEEKKLEMQQTIQQLDSANTSMMVWMRQFDPPSDSSNQEALREYLETQLEMVKKMREDVRQALGKANAKKE
jgi:hypothetical protein